MIQTVEKEKTLLVDGPARLYLISGRASVLGASVRVGDRVVVRKGKRMPFEVLSNSRVELTLGDSASYAETEGSAVPPSWRDACNEIMAQKRHKVILVMGGVDSGKTSLCTYLANLALNAKYKVALIDGDLGQSDIGPPGTVGLSFIKEPVIDLFRLRAEDLIFIGVTNPSKKINATIDALAALKGETLEKGADFLIINTDGWVEGGDAVNYKVRLVETVAPDFVVAMKGENELTSLLDALRDVKVLAVNSPKNVKNRDRETRKLLRESGYKKYLRGAKVRCFPMNWIEIEGDLKLRTETYFRLKGRNGDALRQDALHCEETNLEKEEMKKPESQSDKWVTGFHEGYEEGLLVALESTYGRLLGIGTICRIDSKRRVIKIYTPVCETVSKILVGRIRLDRKGNEVSLV